ncbi:hypothetical protein [Chryseobacterium sp. GM_Chr_2]
MDSLLENHFSCDQELQSGLSTVQFLANQLNVSPNYLSDILLELTGQNAQ